MGPGWDKVGPGGGPDGTRLAKPDAPSGKNGTTRWDPDGAAARSLDQSEEVKH